MKTEIIAGKSSKQLLLMAKPNRKRAKPAVKKTDPGH
jgi:hypothetical protein